MTFTGIKSDAIFIKPSRNFIKLSTQDIFDFFQVKTKNIERFFISVIWDKQKKIIDKNVK